MRARVLSKYSQSELPCPAEGTGRCASAQAGSSPWRRVHTGRGQERSRPAHPRQSARPAPATRPQWLQVFEDRGLISTKRGQIAVANRAKLEGVAGDSYGLCEAEYER